MEDSLYRYIVHESAVVLVLRILLIQVIIGVASLFINGSLLSAVTLEQADHAPVSSMLSTSYAASSMVLQALDAILVVTYMLRWMRTLYIISPTEIVVRDNLWQSDKAVYATSDMREIRVTQSPLGKLCNFGTIIFYSPLLHDEIRLKHIPDPNIYAKVLTHSKPKESVA